MEINIKYPKSEKRWILMQKKHLAKEKDDHEPLDFWKHKMFYHDTKRDTKPDVYNESKNKTTKLPQQKKKKQQSQTVPKA